MCERVHSVVFQFHAVTHVFSEKLNEFEISNPALGTMSVHAQSEQIDFFSPFLSLSPLT